MLQFCHCLVYWWSDAMLLRPRSHCTPLVDWATVVGNQRVQRSEKKWLKYNCCAGLKPNSQHPRSSVSSTETLSQVQILICRITFSLALNTHHFFTKCTEVMSIRKTAVAWVGSTFCHILPTIQTIARYAVACTITCDDEQFVFRSCWQLYGCLYSFLIAECSNY